MGKIKIDVNQSVTSVLPFKPFAGFNNLCLGYLTKVEVTESEAKDSNWEYANETVPRLTFIFEQYKENADKKDRMFFHSELPIASIKVSGEEVTDENLQIMYQEMWKRIKHIHDQYIGTPNYKEIKTVPEFDPDATTEEKLAIFKKFYEAMAKSFNEGKDKTASIFEPYGGKDRKNLLAMKLIASTGKNRRLVFPTFVRTGFVEQAKIKNGKLDTILAFSPNETVDLGSTAVPAGAAGSQTEVSNEIAAQLLDN